MRHASSCRPARAAVLVVAGAVLAAIVSTSVSLRAQAGARERTLFASAVDSAGAPVEGLGPTDFVVREDGVEREVLRVSPASSDPLDVAVLVDNSAAAVELVPRLREALPRFFAALPPQSSIALIGLGDRPTILVDYTNDAARLKNGAGRLFAQPTSGMTLLDAVFEVSRGLEKREAPRAVIVPVLTDGIEYGNRYYQDVVAAAVRSGASLYPVTVGTFPIRTDDETRNRTYLLDEGPRATGGERTTLLSASAVEGALTRLARQLSAQYKVVYNRPESLIPPEKVEVAAARAGVVMHGAPARTPVAAAKGSR